jgi:hypothetical protein
MTQEKDSPEQTNDPQKRRDARTAFYVGLLLAVWTLGMTGGMMFSADASAFPCGRLAALLTGGLLFCVALAMLLQKRFTGWTAYLIGCLFFSCLAGVLLILCFGEAEAGGGIPFIPHSWNQAIARSLVGVFGFIAAAIAVAAWGCFIIDLYRLVQGKELMGTENPDIRQLEAKNEQADSGNSEQLN